MAPLIAEVETWRHGINRPNIILGPPKMSFYCVSLDGTASNLWSPLHDGTLSVAVLAEDAILLG